MEQQTANVEPPNSSANINFVKQQHTCGLPVLPGPPAMAEITEIEVRLPGETGAVHLFRERKAWMLAKLIRAGDDGVTPIEQPAPRISHYVFRLLSKGVPIETIDELPGGPDAGRHGRCRLTAPVEILLEVGT